MQFCSLNKLKDKRRRIIVTAILPSHDSNKSLHNKVYSLNTELSHLCGEFKMSFFNPWNSFITPGNLYAPDGLHLSAVGSSRYGRLLNSHLKTFFREKY